jgi:hypothetical protein
MTPEQRKIELTKKKLGIGELWSKGGTSLTHKYDPDEWNNLAEAAKSRGTYSDAVNGDIDGALSQMTQEELEARLANDGSNLVVVDEDGDHDGYE